ncbi:MAG: LytTR family DNA-binding domain-containing protein [Bacteroides sp.]|nr:LytTR family DNA-binding domain-containing protein [Bacteroides sp.]
MNCIIVDDEPLAREAVELLIQENRQLKLRGTFNSALSAADFMNKNQVDLIFLDIQMPHITGLEFARSIPKTTLVIFTTAYTQYAIDSYEVDAIDYLVKPIEPERFKKVVEKAVSYHSLLTSEDKEEEVESIANDEFMFIKSERRYFKVSFKDILFVEGLKDYVIIQMKEQRIITKMNLKTIHETLPKQIFFRINKSYIINTDHIDSFDNNDVFIGKYEIGIGNSYRESFFKDYVMKRSR